MEKLKIAVVGTGHVATKSYLPYLSQRNDVELFYHDHTFKKAEECERKFGGKAAKSLAELMACGPDTVLVLTHETQRLAATDSLIDFHPRRIFFEKPLVAKNGQADVCEEDFFDAKNLLMRLEKENIQAAMNFNYRFFDQTKRLRELIESKPLGKMLQATLFVNYACWSHCIDLFQCLGGKAKTITALAGQAVYGDGKQSPDTAAAFELENGAAGTILGTSASSFFARLYVCTMNFEGGLIEFSDLDANLSIQMKNSCYTENYSLSPSVSRSNQYSDSFGKSLDAYLDSIIRSAPPPVTGMNGLEELQFEAGLRRSAALKRAVDVQREFPLN
ncbi:MAG: putative oxidoreductase YcjS [Lentisphaerae bacterium ADurb.Bin242]|nr:MAG: putative oxidoreductase YcjS [Lentisphaerae bacterium ADurb.Bin242]